MTKMISKHNVDLFQSKTITLGQEEEPVIVADVLPQGTTENIETTRTYTYADASHSRKPHQTQYVTTEVTPSQYTATDGNVIRYTSSEPSQVQYTTTTTTVQETEDTLPPIHIKMEMTGDDREYRATQIRSTHNQPVHVHSGQVGYHYQWASFVSNLKWYCCRG